MPVRAAQSPNERAVRAAAFAVRQRERREIGVDRAEPQSDCRRSERNAPRPNAHRWMSLQHRQRSYRAIRYGLRGELLSSVSINVPLWKEISRRQRPVGGEVLLSALRIQGRANMFA